MLIDSNLRTCLDSAFLGAFHVIDYQWITAELLQFLWDGSTVFSEPDWEFMKRSLTFTRH